MNNNNNINQEQKRQNFFKIFFETTQNIQEQLLTRKFNSNSFSGLSIHQNQDDKYYDQLNQCQGDLQKFKQIYNDQKMQKAIASFLGNAVGDALGAHTEFINFNQTRNVIQENWESLIEWAQKNNHIRTKYGVITDDCSMARCLADSLLANNGNFNPIDIRLRFLLWWNTGYCNGSQDQRSFGLGGNISQGFGMFFRQNRPPYVFDMEKQKLGNINGNGSIMRLGTIPIAFQDDIQKGQEIAALQSLTTHNGEEAAECCRLLTFLVINLLDYKGDNPKEDIFVKKLKEFKTNCKSVEHMALSKQEEDYQKYYNNFNRCPEDRYWDWQNDKLQVSPTRVQQQPGYFGSYCMDGTYVALYIAYHSTSQKEAIFKAVNWGGDADSIAAVVGYITGAMYGLEQDIWDLYNQQMVQHDNESQLIKAIRLFNKDWVQNTPIFKDENLEKNKDYYLEQFTKKQNEWYPNQTIQEQNLMNKMDQDNTVSNKNKEIENSEDQNSVQNSQSQKSTQMTQ
ncbi:ADP-ribosylation/Crystallin J1 [Pseudocohnilembus persalinus]|uniref:ADP-ribosylhydrolase ARH3 n=1 Tax=Pseudocohnilembus persalinus TaxID=266149 RepID=A0A0V0QBJ4_PSEPJ|nr:ADP-ribosylation/Crystallin J1 [Pseudocohnilembus persalinus]|eukprot:KRW99589.1 ADP-ribosylation/Crystallin J1 [Pseudocohnilembus persalinus]